VIVPEKSEQSGRYALHEPYDLLVRTTCERCVADLLYCDVHDAYFCPICDRWIESACGDPDCTYCVGRAPTPSGCEHDPAHHWNFNE
jgi:hypothetical protein